MSSNIKPQEFHRAVRHAAETKEVTTVAVRLADIKNGGQEVEVTAILIPQPMVMAVKAFADWAGAKMMHTQVCACDFDPDTHKD